MKQHLTVPEAAVWMHRSERTIRRWMNYQLLTIYKDASGRIVLDIHELADAEKRARHANPVRRARKLEMFALMRVDDLSS